MAPTLPRSVEKSGQVWVRTPAAAAARSNPRQNPTKSGQIAHPTALSARGYVRRSGLMDAKFHRWLIDAFDLRSTADTGWMSA